MATLTLRLIDTETSTVDALAKRMRDACDSGKAILTGVKVCFYVQVAERSIAKLRVKLGEMETVTDADAASMRESAARAHSALEVLDSLIDQAERKPMNRFERRLLDQLVELRDVLEDVCETMALGADSAFREDMKTVIEEIHRGPRSEHQRPAQSVGAM